MRLLSAKILISRFILVVQTIFPPLLGAHYSTVASRRGCWTAMPLFLSGDMVGGVYFRTGGAWDPNEARVPPRSPIRGLLNEGPSARFQVRTKNVILFFFPKRFGNQLPRVKIVRSFRYWSYLVLVGELGTGMYSSVPAFRLDSQCVSPVFRPCWYL